MTILSFIESTINLDPIKNRMIKVCGWPKDVTEKVADQYRNFLYLKRVFGKTHVLPPSIEIDEFWHNHILHTKKYHDDCQIIFGEYLHHHPHHGEKGEMLQIDLETLFEEETQTLYYLHFGEYLTIIYPKLYKSKLRNLYGIFKNIIFCKKS